MRKAALARKKGHGLLSVLLTAVLLLSLAAVPAMAEEPTTEYKIYPKPQEMTYQNGAVELTTTINVIYSDGVDAAAKARMEEVAALRELSIVTDENRHIEGKTNVFIGLYGGTGAAETFIADRYSSEYDADLFARTDAYFLKCGGDTIAVLGRDADACFYGLTTLYHIFDQTEDNRLRSFTIRDWADVESRGFIEGYYGRPWSTEDRMDLQKWSGYYKLNAYFYAPKDDPKHRTKWRELYTAEELNTLIRPVAEAGNQSKCRFVYALHPFSDDRLYFGSTYDKDLSDLKDKFMQVIEAGVRQIAILADDFHAPGGANEVRLLNDMTAWLRDTVKPQYPDMKLTIPFVPFAYGGYGGDSEIQSLRSAPDNVQIVMTGGQVFGSVSPDFVNRFYNNVGRGPFMWINWPCTDNREPHLIMGGTSFYLQPGVNPTKLSGVMLNPMQQSEPSKVAIFMNGAYTWNIWDSNDELQQTWNDAFSFVDHNSARANNASDALRELSKHMSNRSHNTGPTLGESEEVRGLLERFQMKLAEETVTEEDLSEVREAFTKIRSAALTYKRDGHERLRGQIMPWLDAAFDTADAVFCYLDAIYNLMDVQDASADAARERAVEAAAKHDESRKHIYYGRDNKVIYAEFGPLHIQPFIRALAYYVESRLDLSSNVRGFYITNRTDTPEGSLENIFDDTDSTGITYKSPNSITAGTYVGVAYNRMTPVSSIRFLLGAGKDHMDHAKLQYTTDKKTWHDLPLTGMNNEFAGVLNQLQDIRVGRDNLPENFEAMGIRLIATADNARDAWLEVREITIDTNRPCPCTTSERVTGAATYSGLSLQSGTLDNLFDGNPATEVWFAKGPYEQPNRDGLPVGATIQVEFDAPRTLGSVSIQQGSSAANDVFAEAELQYRMAGSTDWVAAGTFGSALSQTIQLNGAVNVTAVRLVNKVQTDVWLRLGELDIRTQGDNNSRPVSYNVIKSGRWTVYEGPESRLYDGNDDSIVWYNPHGGGDRNSAEVGDYLGYDLGEIRWLKCARLVVGSSGDKGGDKLMRYAIETSLDGQQWTAVPGYDDYSGKPKGKDIIVLHLTGIQARYIRLRNLETQATWLRFGEFSVCAYDEQPPAVYTLNYELNGGAWVPDYDPPREHIHGTATPLPAADRLQRNGYRFVGWYNNENFTGNPLTELPAEGVTADVTLYARWETVPYRVTYMLNGGTVPQPDTNPEAYTVESESFTLKNPERTGHTFKGWSGTGLTGENNQTVTVPRGSTGDRSYAAHWMADSYRITYILNDGANPASAPESYTYGKGATLPIPVRANFTFEGWYTNAGFTGDPVTAIGPAEMGEKTFYARWEAKPVTYIVVYTDGVADEEVFADDIHLDLSAGDATPAYRGGTPTRAGYVFAGWKPAVAEKVSGNAVYAAQWEEKLPDTGALWWPVPMLALLGAALVGGGIWYGVKKRRKD